MLDPIAKSQMPSALEAADMATSLFVDLPEMRANSANKFFDALAFGTHIAINLRDWQAELVKENSADIVWFITCAFSWVFKHKLKSVCS